MALWYSTLNTVTIVHGFLVWSSRTGRATYEVAQWLGVNFPEQAHDTVLFKSIPHA